MKFVIRKRRTAPTVIIVALIDVLIVLVIFLLVTTTFKQVPSLQLALPQSTQVLKPGVNDNPPIVVTIASHAEGDGVFLGKYPYTVDQLRAQLIAEVAKNPNVKLAVRADKDAAWGRIVAVMDAAKAAHIKLMSAYTKEPGRQ
jgi:biopolymer transport protein ExbD